MPHMDPPLKEFIPYNPLGDDYSGRNVFKKYSETSE